MKISETGSVLPLEPIQLPSRPKAPEAGSAVDAPSVANAVTAAQQQVAASRTARLAAIASAVAKGDYKPDPQQIAEQILDSARVDAQIAAVSGEA